MNYAFFVNYAVVGRPLARQLLSLAHASVGPLMHLVFEGCSTDEIQLFEELGFPQMPVAEVQHSPVQRLILIGRVPITINIQLPPAWANIEILAVDEGGNIDEIDSKGRVRPESNHYQHWMDSTVGRIVKHYSEHSAPVPVVDTFGEFARRYSDVSGPVSPSGFRNMVDPSRARRKDPNSFIIVFLGGSQLHGDACGYKNLFTTQLQQTLNDLAVAPNREVAVFNFGLPGYTQEDELGVFLSRARYLEPDIVVSHSGWNDLVQGLLCPPEVLTQAAAIPNVQRLLKRVTGDSLKCLSRPSSSSFGEIASAYVATWLDFERTARNLGVSRFFKFFQPAPFENGSFSHPEEAEGFERLVEKSPGSRQFYLSILENYYEFTKQASILGGRHGLNCENVVLTGGRESPNFFDAIHLTDAGHKRLCERYVEFFKANPSVFTV